VDFSRPLSAVTEALDGDVLMVLARAERAFSGRHIHQLVGNASEEGVRRVLKRLERQGVVTGESAGAARLFKLNRAHLAAPHIEALSSLRESLVERLRTALSAWAVPPAYAAMFGSFARGQGGTDSDLDLFVVRPGTIDMEDPRWRRQIDALTVDATAWTGNDARMLEYGEGELRIAMGRDDVLRDIRREAIELAGSATVLRRPRQ
jgi:predicted nucleotidyltransferase